MTMTLIRTVARPMLSSMFVVGGINAFKNAEGHAQKAQPVTDRLVGSVRQAVPGAPVPTDPVTLVRINAGVQLVGAAALATGRAPRLGAALLAASLLPTTAAGHRYWEETDPNAKLTQKIGFFKNVSMFGGLLLAAVDTEGKPGLTWRARHAAKDAKREAKHVAKAAKMEAKLATKGATMTGKAAGKAAKGAAAAAAAKVAL
ncbi:MAG: DoxX family membrane protein [Marmoricola sp.]